MSLYDATTLLLASGWTRTRLCLLFNAWPTTAAGMDATECRLVEYPHHDRSQSLPTVCIDSHFLRDAPSRVSDRLVRSSIDARS